MCLLQRFGIRAHAVVLAAILVGRIASAAETTAALPERELIASLIEQLGSTNYATRVEAESSLRQLGVRALDQLKDARSHSNQQVARLAEYLLYSSDLVWYYEGDPPRVRKLLRDYGTDTPMERASTLQRLAALEADEGISALARIARYESNGDLAKRAAILLMQLGDSYVTLDQLSMRWDAIRSVVESGTNAASLWLLHYSNIYSRSIAQTPANYRPDIRSWLTDLHLPKPLPNSDYQMPPLGLIKLQSSSVKLLPSDNERQWWNEQIDAEHKLLHAASRDTSVVIADQLTRLASEFLLRCGLRNDAIEVAHLLHKLPKSHTDLSSTLNRSVWAVDHGFPQIAVELLLDEPEEGVQGQVAEMNLAFRQSSYWQYHLAEAYRWLGDEAKSQAAHERANQTQENFFDRKPTIEHLTVRCQFDWAEEEYRRGLESVPGEEFKLWIALNYMHFLQEGREFKKAFEFAEPYFTKLESDEKYRNVLEESRIGFNVDSLRSNFLYVKAMAKLQDKQVEEAKAAFRSRLNSCPRMSMSSSNFIDWTVTIITRKKSMS